MNKLTEETKRVYKSKTQAQLNEIFKCACLYGHLEDIKYLLTSPDLRYHADIHTDNDDGFKLACENTRLEVMNYLLTSPELSDHINVHTYGDHAFKFACIRDNNEVIDYLMWDYQINLTESITSYLIKYNKEHNKEYLLQSFKVREIYNKLNHQMNIVKKEIKNRFKL